MRPKEQSQSTKKREKVRLAGTDESVLFIKCITERLALIFFIILAKANELSLSH